VKRTLSKGFYIPDWPAPANVKAIQTTRDGGYSDAPFDSFNLGSHVQDNGLAVDKNRQLLCECLPSEPVWLNQVHGVDVIDATKSSCIQDADASFSKNKNVVCVTMTADCLPVLLCNTQGTAVASIHAGWRSLCDGVIEATIKAMGVKPEDLMAWLGPAIGPDAFEVGSEVREAFIAKHAQAEDAFKSAGDKWLGNLYLLAKQRLNKQGVIEIYGGGECTYSNSSQYYSFRRDGITGRMATMIWFE
jgi:polyphenol oxidase